MAKKGKFESIGDVAGVTSAPMLKESTKSTKSQTKAKVPKPKMSKSVPMKAPKGTKPVVTVAVTKKKSVKM